MCTISPKVIYSTSSFNGDESSITKLKNKIKQDRSFLQSYHQTSTTFFSKGFDTKSIVLQSPTIAIKRISLKKSNSQLDISHNVKKRKKYSEEDAKKDLSIVYTQTAVKLVKLYAPSVVLGVASISCIVASNNILKKRNIAIAAAYAGVDKSFKEYRKRVVDKFGEGVDKQLRYNIKAEEVEEKVIDENGEEKVVKKCVNVVNPSEISGYARFFEKYTTDNEGNKIINPNWESNNEYNIMFLKAQERYDQQFLE